MGVSETVTQFNTGAGSKAVLLKSVGVTPTENMLTALRKADHVRVKKAARKITEKARHNRRKLQAKRKSKSKEKVTYMAGGFGLTNEPEDVTGVKKNMKVMNNRVSITKRKTVDSDFMEEPCDLVITKLSDIPVTFVDDDNVHCFITNYK